MKKTVLRLMWYSLYIIVEISSLIMLAAQIPANPAMIAVIITWVIMSIITSYINFTYRKED